MIASFLFYLPILCSANVVGVYSAGNSQELDAVIRSVALGEEESSLPGFVKIESGTTTLVCLRSDPLVAPLLLRRELGETFQALTPESLEGGIAFSALPDQTRKILLDCFESMGFDRAQMQDSKLQLSIVEEFTLQAPEGQTKKAQSFLSSDKGSRLSLQDLSDEEKSKKSVLRNSLIQATPSLSREVRFRFGQAPASRRELTDFMTKAQGDFGRYLEGLESESTASHQLGMQNLYKILAGDLAPLWSSPLTVTELSDLRKRQWMGAVNPLTEEEWRVWTSASVVSAEVNLCFGLRQATSSEGSKTVQFILPFSLLNEKPTR